MDEILETILTNTFTHSLLKYRLLLLKSYAVEKLFGSEKPSPLTQTDLDWLNSLPADFYQKFNKDNVYQLFNDLEAKINTLTPLVLYLPFEANDQINEQIGSFIRKTFNTNLILDIKLNYSLIAGCAISWKGIYRDYSLKARIEEKRGEILQSFKKFLR